MDKLRSFIAIELSEEIKKELQSIQNALRQNQCNYVKWVDTHNMHLTLEFLGDIERSQINSICTAVEGATLNIRPFSLHVQEVGAFPNLARPNILWAGLQGDLKTLTSWQKAIEQYLQPLGFTPESRPFSPHLTLGRVRENATLQERQTLGRLLGGIRLDPGATMIVSCLNLIHSQLTPKGPILPF